jgi:glutathione synthase
VRRPGYAGNVRVGIVISSAASVSATHTTVHVACAALERGHVVRVLEPWDLEVDPKGRLRGRAHVFDAPVEDRDAFVHALQARTALRRHIEVDRLDVLLLRVNPLDTAVLAFARLASEAGVRVLNSPDAVLHTSHKSWLATLAGVPRPRTVVTRSRATVELFASDCEAGIVVKPARSCGGKGVAVVRGRRRAGLDEAIEAAARAGDGYLVVQEYLPAASLGEKRLLWLAGDVLGGYLRERAPGEFRHNLKAGATPTACDLDERDRAVADALGPHLARAGVWLAGIDVIGGLAVEVNTLNPGGVHWTAHFSGAPIARRVVESLEAPGRTPVSDHLLTPVSTA